MKKKSKFYLASAAYRTQVDFEDSIEALRPFFLESNIIIIDRKLEKSLQSIRPKQPTAAIYFLEGSENTKSMATLTSLLEKIFSNRKIELNRKTNVIVIGGGTLGDFGGFLAHILKRGLNLTFVPSTWLSAMDSAHGGKNGINFKTIKNQLGTIYPAKQVILVRSLLNQQPIDRQIEGFGELIKIAYIHSPAFFKKISSVRLNEFDIYSYLPLAIDAKYKIVRQDPWETKGIRYLLNFGHTMAHVWEARLGIHHGIAVLLGMYFDFSWSQHRGDPVSQDLELFTRSEITRGVLSLFFGKALFSIADNELNKLLGADKKKEDQFIRYVFPKGLSKLKVESVSVKEIRAEYHRQKKLVEKNNEASAFKI